MNRIDVSRESSRRQSDRRLFDSIAGAYARKDLQSSSRRARRQRLERTLDEVPMLESWRILEVGCGAGFAAAYLEGRYGHYLGIDQSHRLVEIARAVNGAANVEFLAVGIEDLSVEGGFDLAFMVGVLHHLDDREAAVGKVVGSLRPGGYLALNEPQPANPLMTAARRFRARIDSSYSDDQDEIPGHELRRVLESAGLTEVRTKPQGLFSTPFAEVVLGPQFLTAPAARFACRVDSLLESRLPQALHSVSWNLVAMGRKPEGGITMDRSTDCH
jgi:SAM-dependent methyltransferase